MSKIQKRITATDVAEQRFTPVRRREGYSIDEVDAFLDAVQETLQGQEVELKELEEQVKQAAQDKLSTQLPTSETFSPPEAVLTPEEVNKLKELEQELSATHDRAKILEKQLTDANSQLAMAHEAIESMSDELTTATAQQETQAAAPEAEPASVTASRLLEMAAKQHDEFIAEGKAEAANIMAKAQQALDAKEAEIAQARAQELTALEQEKTVIAGHVASLRALEETSRAVLTEHYKEKLGELSHSLIDEVEATGGKPSPPDRRTARSTAPAPGDSIPVPQVPSALGAGGTSPTNPAPAQNKSEEINLPPSNGHQEYPSFQSSSASTIE